MAYDPSTVYAKYLNSSSSSESGCTDCNQSSSSEECSCCPPGLVGVTGDDGEPAGCLTPNDAALFNASKPCQPGFVKLYKTSTSEFLGCVSEGEFAAIYAAVNPA